MCSVDDTSSLPPRRDRSKKGDGNCAKCGEQATIAMRGPDRLCRACFLHQCRHKFRATLGKARLIRQGDKVLVALSGGLSSSTLVSLIMAGLSEGEVCKLRFVPSLCYIDESAVYGWTENERQEALQLVTTTIKSSGFPHCCLPLEAVFASEEKMMSCIRGCLFTTSASSVSASVQERPAAEDSSVGQDTVNCAAVRCDVSWQTERDQLQRCMSSCNNLTAKEDLLRLLRTHLLAEVAVKNRYSWVMTGDNCTRLVVRLLSDIAQGRGASLPNVTGFADKRREDVVFVRPLREFSAKEVAVYAALQRLTTIGLPTLSTKTEENASIDRQTEAFVMALQADFPSTVSTVFRTGDKLAAEKDPAAESRCIICSSTTPDLQSAGAHKAITAAGHLFGDVQELSLEALRLSNAPVQPSDYANNDSSVPSDHCGSACSCKSSDIGVQNRTADLLHHVCYGCRLVLRDMGSHADELPAWVKSKAAQSQQRAKMRNEIKEFLLEDD